MIANHLCSARGGSNPPEMQRSEVAGEAVSVDFWQAPYFMLLGQFLCTPLAKTVFCVFGYWFFVTHPIWY